jgi:hypothetical protein
MVAATRSQTRNYIPRQIAEKFNVTEAKVIAWCRSGELAAVNVASRSSKRPRFSISPEALADFERARAVAPQHNIGKIA